jgi:hypothetical protein
MVWLSALGLLFDLLGVALLGLDLINVQRAQKTAATRDQKALNDAFPKFNTLEFERTYLETGISGSEGFDGDGGLDARGLDATLRAFRCEIDKSQNGVTDLIEYLFATVGDKARETKRSLVFSYLGLALIVLGFALQLIGLLGPHIFETGGGNVHP